MAKKTRKAGKSIAEQLKWARVKDKLVTLWAQLREQPDNVKNSDVSTIDGVLDALRLAEIGFREASSKIKELLAPTPLNKRTDWLALETEERERNNRLRQKPIKNPCKALPSNVIDACFSGDIGRDEALALLNEWAGLPIEKQNNIFRLRRLVLAIVARLQWISPNRYGDATSGSGYFYPDDIIDAVLKGTLTREQAVVQLDRLISQGHAEG
jgi:hypothetical protein